MFQEHSKVIQLCMYTYIVFEIILHLGYYNILTIASCDIQ